MQIITGEKIQMEADYFIGEPGDFDYNPSIRFLFEKHVSIFSPTFPNVQKHVLIFCYTHLLEIHFDTLCALLKRIPSEFSLLFHNSDGAFKEKHESLLNIPNLRKIYSQNLMIQPTDTVVPIPIGIANSMWNHGNLSAWKSILEMTSPIKTNRVYFNFNIHTNVHLRSACHQEMMKKNVPIQPSLDYKEYLQRLRTFQYAICPEGNGKDTHRFWECLYLKTIPICTRNHVTVYYSQFYPVVLIDSWEALDLNCPLHTAVTDWSNYDLLDFHHLPFVTKRI